MYATQVLKLLAEPVDVTTASGRARCLQIITQMVIYITTLHRKLDLRQLSQEQHAKGQQNIDTGW